MFWSDAGLLEFMTREFPDLLELYLSYPKPVQRADLARYCLLKHFGGLYADIDTRCLTSLEPLAGDMRVIICEEPPEHHAPALVRGLKSLYFNGTLASPPGHPFWDNVIDKCMQMRDRRHFDVLETTGPLILTAAVEQWPDKEQLALNDCMLFAGLTAHWKKSAAPAHGPFSHLKLSEHLWQGSWYKRRRERSYHRNLGRLRKLRHALFSWRYLNLESERARIDTELLTRPLISGAENEPPVSVLIPVRNAERFLPTCFDLICGLDYPKDKINIVFGHGDSEDQSKALIDQFKLQHGAEFAGVRCVKTLENPLRVKRSARWKPKYQRARRAALARARNQLLREGLGAEAEWALWIDADLVDYPPDILRRLLREREKIVTPDCVLVPGGPSYDLNAFLSAGVPTRSEYHRHLKGGILQPPADWDHRRHLHDLRYLSRVPLNGVGGTMLLVHADVHRAGLNFPERPYRDLIETEAFGQLARDLGVTPIGLPQVEIVHTSS
jgi:hypothetical protein